MGRSERQGGWGYRKVEFALYFSITLETIHWVVGDTIFPRKTASVGAPDDSACPVSYSRGNF
jgi:hypothetical protein